MFHLLGFERIYGGSQNLQISWFLIMKISLVNTGPFKTANTTKKIDFWDTRDTDFYWTVQ